MTEGVIHMLSSLNSFIEKRMAIVTPLCVLAGVAFPEITGKWQPLVPFIFAFMTFIGGLKSSVPELIDVIRKPRPLLLSLLGLHVIVPLLALLVGNLLFPGDDNVITGMVLEFIVPSAVVGLMWSSIYHGSSPLSLALVIIDTVLAPFSIPLTLHILLGEIVHIDAAEMMQELLFMIAVPAVLAIILNEATHGFTRCVWPGKLAIVSKLCLILVVSSNSSKISSYVRNIAPRDFLIALAILLIAASGYAVGWLLANLLHEKYEIKTSMMFGCGMRNINAGAVIAGSYFPAEVMFPVMVGTLFQQLLAVAYGTLLTHRTAVTGGKGTGAGAEQGQ